MSGSAEMDPAEGEGLTAAADLAGEFASVLTNADGNLFVETYNQLNAYFATIPVTCPRKTRPVEAGILS
jgi:hypothetical protein